MTIEQKDQAEALPAVGEALAAMCEAMAARFNPFPMALNRADFASVVKAVHEYGLAEPKGEGDAACRANARTWLAELAAVLGVDWVDNG